MIGIIFGIIGAVFAFMGIIIAISIIYYTKTIPGQGKPKTQKEITQELMKLNKKPIKIEQEKNKLELIWTIVDAKWIEALGPAWKNKTFKATIELDDANKTATYKERIYSKETTFGPLKATGNYSFFRGIQLFKKEKSKAYGIKRDFTIGKIYDYTFSPIELREELIRIITEKGWTVKIKII